MSFSMVLFLGVVGLSSALHPTHNLPRAMDPHAAYGPQAQVVTLDDVGSIHFANASNSELLGADKHIELQADVIQDRGSQNDKLALISLHTHREDFGMAPLIVAFLFVFVAISSCILRVMCQSEDPQDTPGDGDDQAIVIPNETLEPDVFSFVYASLIRDEHAIAKGDGDTLLRFSRSAVACILAMCNIALQLVLMIELKQLVMRPNTNKIRELYDNFEILMYGANHTVLASDGMHRGTSSQYFQPERFDQLSVDEQTQVCNIPFSQPVFVFCVLFVWSITCFGEVQQCMRRYINFVVLMPALADNTHTLRDGSKPGYKIVDGVTRVTKVLVTLLVFLPRLAVASVLLWMGSRWLAATTSLENLLIRAVALGFIIRLKDLLYQALVPYRNKLEVTSLEIAPRAPKQKAGWRAYFEEFSWGLLAIAWVILYMYRIQSVLPGYRWDVSVVCTPWIKEHFRLGA